MANKKLTVPKKTKKTIPTNDHSKVATPQMSSVPSTSAGAAVVLQGMPGSFLLRPTHAPIQALPLPTADHSVPTVVLVDN
jgi:hypothetical protein